MRLSKILKLSFNMLAHSKLRSWLTIIGIFIGVAAVVAIISLGQGLQSNVNSRLQGLGQDLITISTGSSRAFSGGFGEGGGRAQTNIIQLNDKDIQALKLVAGIKSINGVVSGRVSVTYQSQNISLSVQGDDPTVIKDFVTTAIDTGRYLAPGDTKTIMVGYGVAHGTFRTDLGVGSLLIINGKPYRIIGILASSSGFGGGGGDRGIYMTTKDAREVLGTTITLKSNEYSSITVKVNDANFVNETTAGIEDALRNSHHVAAGKEDFSVSSAQALQARFSSVTQGITLFLAVIAAVSLFVGCIGVANTMFTSVLEKTRDIGIMKAIGARNSDILMIFLLNSGMLGLVGGLLGILFALLIAGIVPSLGVSLGGGTGEVFSMPINLSLMFFAVVFSVALGMVSGAIPAYQASKLNPVEALRYE